MHTVDSQQYGFYDGDKNVEEARSHDEAGPGVEEDVFCIEPLHSHCSDFEQIGDVRKRKRHKDDAKPT